MKYHIRMGQDQGRLMREIRARAGVDLSKCYQCGECTAGCPITQEMDAGPTKTLRLIQLGMEEELFELTTPWLCASCETCTTRCPNDIDIARVMDVVRQMARLRGKKIPLKDPVVFQDVFLGSMKTHGTLFEPEMMALYNLKSFHLFHDVSLGPPMLFKGKLPLLPHRSKNRQRLQAIFERAEAYERRQDQTGTEEGHGAGHGSEQ
jgi:heterodisulfide reductase subunit C